MSQLSEACFEVLQSYPVFRDLELIMKSTRMNQYCLVGFNCSIRTWAGSQKQTLGLHYYGAQCEGRFLYCTFFISNRWFILQSSSQCSLIWTRGPGAGPFRGLILAWLELWLLFRKGASASKPNYIHANIHTYIHMDSWEWRESSWVHPKILWQLKIVAFGDEQSKWDQNPWFTTISETTSIPEPFIWESLQDVSP